MSLERLAAPKPEGLPLDVTRLLHRTSEVLQPISETVDTTLIDPKAELPIWRGQASPLYVTDIIEETLTMSTPFVSRATPYVVLSTTGPASFARWY